MARLMVGPGDLKGIFQHDSLILMCEYENVKLLKKMSIVQGELTNKIDFFPPDRATIAVFHYLSLQQKNLFPQTSLTSSLVWHQPKPEGVRAPCVHKVAPNMNFGDTTRCLWSGELRWWHQGANVRVLRVLWAAQGWLGQVESVMPFLGSPENRGQTEWRE